MGVAFEVEPDYKLRRANFDLVTGGVITVSPLGQKKIDSFLPSINESSTTIGLCF